MGIVMESIIYSDYNRFNHLFPKANVMARIVHVDGVCSGFPPRHIDDRPLLFFRYFYVKPTYNLNISSMFISIYQFLHISIVF